MEFFKNTFTGKQQRYGVNLHHARSGRDGVNNYIPIHNNQPHVGARFNWFCKRSLRGGGSSYARVESGDQKRCPQGWKTLITGQGDTTRFGSFCVFVCFAEGVGVRDTWGEQEGDTDQGRFV